MRLQGIAGRRALVTGAGQGIGRAIAERLAREGANVAVNDVIPERAALAAGALSAISVPFDVSDPTAVDVGVEECLRQLGGIDILVANHAFMSMAPFEHETTENWRRMIDVNLFGTGMLVERCAPEMSASGWGRIVVIASEWGVIGWPNATAYAATKHGLISLVKSLARALGPRGIAVNAVAPGITDTPQLEVDARDAGLTRERIVSLYGKQIPLGRVADPQEIASVVAFLCSEYAISFVGQLLQPNGGTTRTWTV